MRREKMDGPSGQGLLRANHSSGRRGWLSTFQAAFRPGQPSPRGTKSVCSLVASPAGAQGVFLSVCWERGKVDSALGQELDERGTVGPEPQSQNAPAQGTSNDSGLRKPVPRGQGCLGLYRAPASGVVPAGCPTECWEAAARSCLWTTAVHCRGSVRFPVISLDRAH